MSSSRTRSLVADAALLVVDGDDGVGAALVSR
jgi:hypothetical protein